MTSNSLSDAEIAVTNSNKSGWVSVRKYAERSNISVRRTQQLIRDHKIQTIGEGHQKLCWLGLGEPIAPSAAIDELEAFAEALSPEESIIKDICWRLAEVLREIDFTIVGPSLQTETERTGAAFLLTLAKIKRAQAKQRPEKFHL